MRRFFSCYDVQIFFKLCQVSRTENNPNAQGMFLQLKTVFFIVKLQIIFILFIFIN